MTEQEFRKFIEEQHGKGKSDEDIVKVFAKMFQDEKCSRDEFEGLINAIGYELSSDFGKLSDDELREKVLVGNPGKAKPGTTKKEIEEESVDPDGGPAPVASKSKEQDDDSDSKDDGKPESKDDSDDERKEAMKLFGLRD